MKSKPRLHIALRFVLLIGVLSFFADFTYEGARSITGPFLGLLGASAAVISIVAGLGELLGYGLRLISGPLAERTGRFWAITIFGYVVQMTAVPLLALATTWQVAAGLIILERVGKAARNPPRDVMLSHAAKEMGYGWGFGIHEALDQFGALFGPLLIAAILASHHAYSQAFAALVVPAVITLVMVIIARNLYPKPEDLETAQPIEMRDGLPMVFWLYLLGAVLVAAGFADFSLIAYHFQASVGMSPTWLPICYAIAMAVSGSGSLLFGKLFDRFGLIVLIPVTLVAATFAPLVFLGNFWLAIVGSAVWGLGMGVHESVIPAAVAHMVARKRRATAYGVFTGSYGVAWFLGSVAIGLLYGKSIAALVVFCVVTQLAAVPVFVAVARHLKTTTQAG